MPPSRCPPNPSLPCSLGGGGTRSASPIASARQGVASSGRLPNEVRETSKQVSRDRQRLLPCIIPSPLHRRTRRRRAVVASSLQARQKRRARRPAGARIGMPVTPDPPGLRARARTISFERPSKRRNSSPDMGLPDEDRSAPQGRSSRKGIKPNHPISKSMVSLRGAEADSIRERFRTTLAILEGSTTALGGGPHGWARGGWSSGSLPRRCSAAPSQRSATS